MAFVDKFCAVQTVNARKRKTNKKIKSRYDILKKKKKKKKNNRHNEQYSKRGNSRTKFYIAIHELTDEVGLIEISFMNNANVSQRSTYVM